MVLLLFVIAKRVARSILECVYCCHTAKRVSASGVHKTQPKVPIQGPNHPNYTGATPILVQLHKTQTKVSMLGPPSHTAKVCPDRTF